mmetsp:Transcript_19325/g.37016  ORF Transcript_19325/g.37016 Transcript_19325/m.37016 type:complete len:301 (+) Transcript_19325:1390-2292(+)
MFVFVHNVPRHTGRAHAADCSAQLVELLLIIQILRVDDGGELQHAQPHALVDGVAGQAELLRRGQQLAGRVPCNGHRGRERSESELHARQQGGQLRLHQVHLAGDAQQVACCALARLMQLQRVRGARFRVLHGGDNKVCVLWLDLKRNHLRVLNVIVGTCDLERLGARLEHLPLHAHHVQRALPRNDAVALRHVRDGEADGDALRLVVQQPDAVLRVVHPRVGALGTAHPEEALLKRVLERAGHLQQLRALVHHLALEPHLLGGVVRHQQHVKVELGQLRESLAQRRLRLEELELGNVLG